MVLEGSTRAHLSNNTISHNLGDGIVARGTVYTSYLRWSGRPHADAEIFLGSVETAGNSWTLNLPERAGIAFLSATATLTAATSELSAPFLAPDGSFRLEITSMDYVPPLPGGPPPHLIITSTTPAVLAGHTNSSFPPP